MADTQKGCPRVRGYDTPRLEVWCPILRSGINVFYPTEIMDILIVKKAHAPPPPPAPRKNRVTSVPVIPYDTLMEEPVLSTGFSESMNIPSDPQAAFQAMNENADPGPSTLPNEAMALDNQAKDGEECAGELLHSSLSSDDSDSG